MIQSLEISNFRGFKQVTLSGLPRFNLLIGGSGSGKTAFLEALWITGGISPEIYFRMRHFRGMGEQAFQLSGDKLSYETFFSDIFHDPSGSPAASISIMDNSRGARSLRIDYDPSQQMILDITKPISRVSDATRLDLVFHWVVNEKDYRIPLKIHPTGQIIVENPPEAFPAIFYASSFTTSARENAERLSILRIKGEKRKIVETIARIFPDIGDLSSESIANQQMIWASMNKLHRMIPIPVVSSGINKFISILLWIALNPKGVILLDEAENSFYFVNYEVVFRTLVEFCDTYDVQLFAATHSKEFLNAVATVMETRHGDLSMLHTKYKNGECFINQIEGVSALEAINQGIEIRI
jgi:hypothetical protein